MGERPELLAPPADLAAFIKSESFPCVGAKSALALGHLHALEAGDIRSGAHDEAIHDALVAFAGKTRAEQMSSFACMFSGPARALDEKAFEAAMWARLQALHELDLASGLPWARGVARDPNSPHFAMSIGATAFFIVGLHPGASRAARRFSRPALIFNPHDQFERLRADGRYFAMQELIREREVALQGAINPMLSNFGERQQAAQYSGRAVSEGWRCPFKAKA